MITFSSLGFLCRLITCIITVQNAGGCKRVKEYSNKTSCYIANGRLQYLTFVIIY